MINILVTNDDGFDSPGLEALLDSIGTLGRILVVAPSSEKSACGHGLTLTKPLRFIKVKDNYYKLDDGTPTDCVYLALNAFYDKYKPNLILSGINIGSNMGEDITYSGTIAGAMEGAIYDIPSIAFSQYLSDKNMGHDFDFSLARDVVYDVVTRVINNGFPVNGRKFLNVNIPDVRKKDYKGIKITELGYRIYGNNAHVNRNPRGQEYYWLGLHSLNWEERDGNNSDFKAIKEGYASMTPIMLDLTSRSDLDSIKDWIAL